MTDVTKPKWHKRLKAKMIELMDPEYDLIYVAYDDKFTDEQVAALVRGDWDTFWGSFEPWEGDARWQGVTYHMKDLGNDAQRALEAETGKDLAGLYDDFEHTDLWDEVRFVMEERESGDWIKSLASHTGRVLMRSIIVNEDDGWAFEKVTPTEVLKAYGLKRNKHNVALAREILRECSPEYSVLLGMIVYAVDVADVYNMPMDTEYVDIIDPFLYLGNPFAGSGYCDGPAKGTIRIERAQFQTDKDCFGYAWNEVAGVYTSAYEVEFKPVPVTHEPVPHETKEAS
jgi:hypothetical protein